LTLPEISPSGTLGAKSKRTLMTSQTEETEDLESSPENSPMSNDDGGGDGVDDGLMFQPRGGAFLMEEEDDDKENRKGSGYEGGQNSLLRNPFPPLITRMNGSSSSGGGGGNDMEKGSIPWSSSNLSTRVGSELVPLSGIISINASPGKGNRSRHVSPVTTVTPSRVSKEEFEKDWDTDWNPTTSFEEEISFGGTKQLNRSTSTARTNNRNSKRPVYGRDVVQDGSFPTLASGHSKNTADSEMFIATDQRYYPQQDRPFDDDLTPSFNNKSNPKQRHNQHDHDEHDLHQSPANYSHGRSQNSSNTHYHSTGSRPASSPNSTLDWSNKGSEYGSDSEDEEKDESTPDRGLEGHAAWDRYATNEKKRKAQLGLDTSAVFFTPSSSPHKSINTSPGVTDNSNGSGLNGVGKGRHASYSSPSASRNSSAYTSGEGSTQDGSSHGSSSKQLINDLVWLEKKIADVRARVNRLDGDDSSGTPASTPEKQASSPDFVTSRSESGSPISGNIVCRDCMAPPGKLQIVIHSTKDGPTIHDVRPGSSLEGQIFVGDLLVAVDDTDTRTFTAEAVMEVMVAKSSRHRKLTVLHFEEHSF